MLVLFLKHARLLDFLFCLDFFFFFLGLSFWACMHAYASCMRTHTHSVCMHATRMRTNTHVKKLIFTSFWFSLLSFTCLASV